MLQEYNISECVPSSKPMDPGAILIPDVEEKTPAQLLKLKRIPYQNAIGSLMYLLQSTRPDIAYVF